MQSIQVTLLATATPIWPTAVQVPSQSRISFQVLMVQNNSTHVVRFGDASVSATKGLALAAGSTTPTPILTISPALEYSSDLSDYYLFGTVGDVIDILYVD